MKKEIIKFSLNNHKFMEDAFATSNELKQEQESTYFFTYIEFISFFKNKETLDIIIGMCFTYSWMPTGLDFKKLDNKKNIETSINEIIPLFNSVKNGGKLYERELEMIKKIFNNSLIGTSKILHFLNPENYAIWDSRVFRYLTNHKLKPHTYRLENIPLYLSYLCLVKEIAERGELFDMKKDVEKVTGYKITDFRFIELVMFINGNSQK